MSVLMGKILRMRKQSIAGLLFNPRPVKEVKAVATKSVICW